MTFRSDIFDRAEPHLQRSVARAPGGRVLAAVIVVLSALWVLAGPLGVLLAVLVAAGAVALRRAAIRRRRRRAIADQLPPSAQARTFRQQVRHDVQRVVAILIAIAMIWNGLSFVRYVAHDNGDTLSERVATWARNNHLGVVIDRLETQMYRTPPSRSPAQDLALASSRARSGAGAAAAPVPAPQARQGANGAVPTTGPAPVSGPPPVPPRALTPMFSPALPGEGQWSVIARAAGRDAIWATSIRPLPSAGGVVASMVVIDQSHLRAGLFNGAEEPGGTWRRGNRVPAELQPALLAAMNGGFRFEHIKGGYKTEGVTVKPLRNGDATLAIGSDGHVAIGQLGRDLFDDGSWISLRQNLVLIVDHGRSQVQHGIDEGVWWGADYGNKVYVPRSAVCQLADGRIAYALVGKVDAFQLGDSLVNLGCVTAMEMDINGTWPVFFTFSTGADGTMTGQFLDKRMGGSPTRYLTGSTKEFIAFFDATLVPAHSALDG